MQSKIFFLSSSLCAWQLTTCNCWMFPPISRALSEEVQLSAPSTSVSVVRTNPNFSCVDSRTSNKHHTPVGSGVKGIGSGV